MESEESVAGQTNYLMGRSLALDPFYITDKQKKYEVADFHDIVALCLYGESLEEVFHFIHLRLSLMV